jgi:hypothetical protein
LTLRVRVKFSSDYTLPGLVKVCERV